VVPSVVVVLEPWLLGLGSFAIAGEDLPVGPFGLQCPVESFNFPVLPGAVGPDCDVVGSDGVEGVGERLTLGVGPVVVGNDLLDAVDAVIGEELGGSD